MDKDLKKVIYSLVFPVLFLVLLWTVKIIELQFGISFAKYGILPLKAEGLPGIIFSPLIHGSLDHLTSNSVPILVLGWALFYYYYPVSLKVFFLSWFVSGIWVWVFARESYHIGASTIVYALAAFHIISALIRREKRLLAFMLIVFFQYGSMIWGLFPDFFPNKNISWEGHLMGTIAGIILAVFYRKEGPQRQKFDWEYEEEEEDEEELDNEKPYWMINDQDIDPRELNVRFKYHYRSKKKNKN